MWWKFKWDMFVTSFIPLWISIIVIDIWHVATLISKKWENKNNITENLLIVLKSGKIQLISIFIVLLIVGISIFGINSFLKRIYNPNDKSSGKLLKVSKANKLSSEFLLAYILPMIAFDFGDMQNIILFLIYFAVLAYLCIRNNNIYTNIFLEFKGYKMYNCNVECTVVNKKQIYLDSLVISKTDLTQEVENSIFFWDFDNYIYITMEGETKQ